MVFRSRYHVALLKMDRDLKKKEKELLILVKERRAIETEIARQKEEQAALFEQIRREGTISPAFTGGATPFHFFRMKELHDKLRSIRGEWEVVRSEYVVLSLKKQQVEERKQAEEKEFYRTVRKKEDREVEEMKRMQEFRKRRDET